MLPLRLLSQVTGTSAKAFIFGCGVSRRGLKVAVVGAAGGIGQPLSLLLKQNPHISMLALHDLKNTSGVVVDLSHINTPAMVCSFEGKDGLKKAMDKADIVVIPAGLPRKPGMKREDLVDVNASVACEVAYAASAVCPAAFLAFITNPINVIVPIVATILKAKGTYDPNRLFGVTTLDVVRSKTFIGDILNVNPQTVEIPVIGGHTGTTILPILSQCKPPYKGSDEERDALIHRIQEAGTEVVNAKNGQGSATLSMAYAASNFVNSLIKGIKGSDGECIVECAYVESDVTEACFFATPLILGPQGIEENLGLPEMDDKEQESLECMLPILKENIKKGIKMGEDMACKS
ncbi:probable malate dehydrogenase, mitochondrial [Drosophila ficusphila]|uniref:probable malate dehydrogenase, mitochondrial n=1 Tax=Drosophila ficusphila TaxID=30025 RepID=UPI0007E5F517|nr:probable malate dehydrogenase, mitochondrial [Drosophila ficusphila]